MLSDKEIKKKMFPEFKKDYKKFYPVKTLSSLGLERHICKKCGRGFWSAEERDFCDESSCQGGYYFIGKKIAKEPLTYKESWDAFVKTFKKWDYTPIDRYPVVCRWYDELYFVAAGINDFQPYVVSGDVEPVSRTVLEPQFCLRFLDIDNVGVTGRHMTGFIMAGQHVFNPPGKLIYFKEEGISQIYEFLTKGLKIPAKHLCFHEDMWAGGGNFGPSIEYFSGGLELGNQVYMQYKVKESGFEELKTRVIDMGAGLERWAWFTNGGINAYETTFPLVLKNIRKKTGFSFDANILRKFAPYSALFDVDELEDKGKMIESISNLTGVSAKELIETINRASAIYSIADHTRTLLVALHDGALPSNTAGGYNLRVILRRALSMIEKYNMPLELQDVFDWHIKEFGSWFKELQERGSLNNIISEEISRYKKTKETGKITIFKILEKERTVPKEKLLELYDSKGIQPELVKEIAENKGFKVSIPDNFYALIQERHKKEEVKHEKLFDLTGVKATKKLYFYKPEKEFTAKVIRVLGNIVILDSTGFYPKSGGQEGDTGKLNSFEVEEVSKQGDVILHKVKNHNLKSGSKVKGEINWERRRVLTKSHSAIHILGLACREILGPHIFQSGSEKTTKKARLDITHYKSIDFEEMQKIEKLANKIIFQDLEVKKEILPRTEAEKKYGMNIYQGGAVPGKELRIISVGKDHQACGGTHVDRTSEIGFLKILSSSRISDGVVRMEISVENNAVSEMQSDEKEIKKVLDMWNISKTELYSTSERFFREWKNFQKEIKEKDESFLDSLIQNSLDTQAKVLRLRVPIDNIAILMNYAKKYDSQLNERAIILIGKNVCFALSKNSAISAKKELESVCKKIDGNEKSAKGFELLF